MNFLSDWPASRSLAGRPVSLRLVLRSGASQTQFVRFFRRCLYRLWRVPVSLLLRKCHSRDSRSFVSPVKTASSCLLCPLTRLEVTFHTFFWSGETKGCGGGEGWGLLSGWRFHSVRRLTKKTSKSINNFFGPQKLCNRPWSHL